MIYADNAATTRLDSNAFEVMKPFLLESFSNPSQPYSFSRESKKAIKEARKTIADCIGASPDEIIFTSGGTESDNWVIKKASKDGTIITTKIEHHAILNACKSLECSGITTQYLNVNHEGIVSPEELESMFDASTNLVSVMYANNEIGSIQDIANLARISHKHDCLFHTDAVQAVGHVDINVRELGVDFLSASAHKFNGPKGIGFLFKRDGINLSPLIDGGAQECGLRAGTENVASIVGMAEALKNNCSRIHENHEHIYQMENALIERLRDANLDFVRNGSINHVPGNISLSFRNADGEALLHRLDLMGICVSTGSACDSVNTQVSHVLKAINLDEEYAKGTIRISLGKDNTINEAYIIAESLIKMFSY